MWEGMLRGEGCWGKRDAVTARESKSPCQVELLLRGEKHQSLRVGSKRPVKVISAVPAPCGERLGGERGCAAAPGVNY